eukprot:403344213
MQDVFLIISSATKVVSDTVSNSASYQLNLASSSDFIFYSDGWGTQFSGQYAKKDLTSTFIGVDSFYMQFFFYVCDTKDFFLFCHQQDTTSTATYTPIFCLSFNSNSHPVVTVRLKNEDSNDYYQYTQEYASLTIQSGWVWLGVHVYNNLNGQTYITLYESRNAYTTGTKDQSQVYKFTGIYTDSFANTEIVFGCLLVSEGSQTYGYCMKGFIYLFSVFTDDTFIPSGSPTVSILHTCSSVTTCQLCDYGYKNACLDKTAPQTIETWTLVNNAGFTSDKITATNNPTLYSLTRNSDRAKFPLSLYNIGILFGYEVQSFYLKNKSPSTYLPMGPMFTIEAWIKFGDIEDAPPGLLMPIFGKYTTTIDQTNQYDRKYKVGIAVSNYFMRTYINSLHFDVDYRFIEEPNWHYVAASYIKTQKSKTQLLIFIDGQIAANTIVSDVVNYNFDGYLSIGDRFNGAIKQISLKNHAYCLSNFSESISTSATVCTTCSFCDMTAGCYTDCPSLPGYYINSTNKCTACDNSCEYCKSNSANECFLCNRTQNRVWTYLTPTTGNDYGACSCNSGTYYNSTTKSCETCNELCWACEDSTADKCSSCSDKGYKLFGSSCVASCPSGYKASDTYKTCIPDNPNFSQDTTSMMNKGYYAIDRINEKNGGQGQGCQIGEYYNYTTKTCTVCPGSNCETCDQNKPSICLKCKSQAYLAIDGTCRSCISGYMNFDYFGQCVENCGDGKRFTFEDYAPNSLQCDDGNAVDGDGCSKSCRVEIDYRCQGGVGGRTGSVYGESKWDSENSKDTFYGFTPEKIFDISVTTSNGTSKDVSWTQVYPSYEVTTNYVLFRLKFEDSFSSGAYYDNMVKLKYKNEILIFDINNQTLKSDIWITTFLQAYNQFTDKETQSTEALAFVTLFVALAIIGLNLFYAAFFKKPPIIMVLTLIFLQQVFFIGCQDLTLTNELYFYFRHFKNFIFQFQSLDNALVTDGLIKLDDLQYRSFNNNLYLLAEFEYNNFVINAYGKFILWIFCICLILAVTITDFLMQEYSNWRSKMLISLRKGFYFSGLLLVFQITLTPMGLPATLIIADFSSKTSQVSNIIDAFFALVIILVTFTYLVFQLMIVQLFKNYRYHPIAIEKFVHITKPFKQKWYNMLFWPMLTFKQVFVFLIQGMLFSYSKGPIYLIIFVNFIFLSYLLAVRPFKKLTDNLVCITFEVVLISIEALLITFVELSSENTKQERSWAIMCLTLISLLLALIFVSFEVFQKLRRYRYFIKYQQRYNPIKVNKYPSVLSNQRVNGQYSKASTFDEIEDQINSQNNVFSFEKTRNLKGLGRQSTKNDNNSDPNNNQSLNGDIFPRDHSINEQYNIYSDTSQQHINDKSGKKKESRFKFNLQRSQQHLSDKTKIN